MVPVSALKKLFGAEHFTELLTPCLPFEDKYFLADGGLGQIWEIEGWNIDGKSQAEMDAFSARLRSLFLFLSEDVSFQIIACSWRGAAGIGNLQNGNPGVTPAVSQYLRNKLEQHNKAVSEGFFLEGNHMYAPRTIKTYVTAKVLNRGASSGRILNRTEWANELAKLEKIETIIESSLSVNQVGFKRQDPNKVIDLMYRILHPQTSTAIAAPQYTGGDMRDYMVKSPPRLQNGEWVCDEHVYKTISFKKNPALVEGSNGTTQYVTRANMLFRELEGVSFFDYLDRFVFAMTIHMPNSEKFLAGIDRKRWLTFMNRFSFSGDTAIDKTLIKEDTDKIVHETYSGNKVLKAGYHLCFPVAVNDADMKLKTAQAIQYLDRMGCAAIEEDLIGAGIFLRCLPFGFNQYVPGEDVVRRSHSVMASNLADIAPFYAFSRGSKTDIGVLHYNRRGLDTYFDPFDPKTSSTAPHVMITGETGAGKSVTACDFIMQALRQQIVLERTPRDAHVIVIDKGNSYLRINQVNNGQYLRFEGVPDVKLDPFLGNKDDDHRAFLVSLLCTMISGGTEQISREEVATISECVYKVLQQNPESPAMNDVVAQLQTDADPISRSLAKRLFPFYGNGQYSRFFEGDKPSLDINNKFTVFELGDVEAHKDLQAVIVTQLVHYITEFVKSKPGGRKYLFVDEAWSLFRNEVAVGWLVKAVKTFRKLGVSVVFLTQQLDDFKIVADALNMADNCPNQILLRQNYDVISRMRDTLGLSEGELDMYRSVRKGERYSEALIKTPGWSSLVRIILDPNAYWLTTSKDTDKAYLERLMVDMSLADAVSVAAREHPYGV